MKTKKTIRVNTWEGNIHAVGTRLESNLIKSFNDEVRDYIDNGLWATSIVYTEVYEEKWDFNGTVISLKKTVQKKKNGDKVFYGLDMDDLSPDNPEACAAVIAVLKSAN